MKISDNFKKLFPVTAERLDVVNHSYMSEMVDALKEFKQKYPDFKAGEDMIGHVIKVTYDNGFNTATEILRIKSIDPIMRPTMIVDMFFKTDKNPKYEFYPNQLLVLDMLAGRGNIVKYPKSKYDKMFISHIGADYLKSLNL